MITEQPVNNGCYPVMADIDSLYINMNVQICTDIIKTYLHTHFTSNVTNNLMKLVAINLNCNDFIINGEHFLQVSGVAMGKAFVPHLANMYLATFDEKDTTGFRHKPRLYKRFIDDQFFIREHSLDNLNEFQQFLNSLIPRIKLTFTYSTVSINFWTLLYP